MGKRMMHLACCAGEIAGYALMLETPEDVRAAAQLLGNAREVAHNREYLSFTGQLDGTPVSLASGGAGGPAVCIAVEELHACGAHTVVWAGSYEALAGRGATSADGTGALAGACSLAPGELLLPNGAVRAEGVSAHYAPPSYPAVPSMDVLACVEEAACQEGALARAGLVASASLLPSGRDAAALPLAAENARRWERYRAVGAVAADLACAPLFVAASSLGVRAAAVLAEGLPGAPSGMANHAPSLAIRIGLRALRLIIARDAYKAGVSQ